MSRGEAVEDDRDSTVTNPSASRPFFAGVGMLISERRMMRGPGLSVAGGEGLGGTSNAADNATTSRNERESSGRWSDPPEEPDPGLDIVQRSSLEWHAGRKGFA